MVSGTPTPTQQPWLHDLVLCLAAPVQAWSSYDGQVRPGGASGVYLGDRRVLHELVLDVDGRETTPVAQWSPGGDRAVFVGVPRWLGDPGPDPTVRLERRRTVERGALVEEYVLSSTAAEPVTCRVGLDLGADLLGLDVVKSGGTGGTGGRQPAEVRGTTVTWRDDGLSAVLHLPGDAVVTARAGGARASWTATASPGAPSAATLRVELSEDDAVVTAPARSEPWAPLEVDAADRRLGPVLARCLDDLRLLRLAGAGGEEFVAAGAPWYLTLFGRDSLWTARMLLPVTTDLAGSTLRLLAGMQGATVDHGAAEEPGKILHEVRRASFSVDEGDVISLPPVYYGTIDATPLWVLLLHDAWRWGLPEEQVEALLGPLERALAWQVEHGDADGDHLLEYVDHSGTGLANQGWKDSRDAVRHRDGSWAPAPVALCEVQGYAYAAAVRGADLLEHFGRGGTDRWRSWAARAREAFHASFWVEDDRGAFPAIALDRDKRPAASMTSNAGHLLGTGLLDAEQAAAVAQRLAAPDMLSGWGVRTMSSAAAGYSPTGYHVGSVWPHDTAICLAGLAAEGRPEVAPVAEALLSALAAFDGRPPELFAGDERAAGHAVPLPYPASCRPQAWSAAAAVSLLASVTGLAPGPDGPVAAPVAPWSFGATSVAGLQHGGRPLAIDVAADGTATLRRTT